MHPEEGGEGLAGMCCEERLSMPGLSSLEEKRLRSNLTSLCSWGSAEGGLFPAHQQWDAREQHRDVLGKFRWSIRQNFFAELGFLEVLLVPCACQCLRGTWSVHSIVGPNFRLALKRSGSWT